MPPPPLDDDIDPVIANSSGTYRPDQNRSGLLVVLDDEEDDIPSDRIDRQTARGFHRGIARRPWVRVV